MWTARRSEGWRRTGLDARASRRVGWDMLDRVGSDRRHTRHSHIAAAGAYDFRGGERAVAGVDGRAYGLMEPTRVLIAEDNPRFREGLVALLRSTSFFEV